MLNHIAGSLLRRLQNGEADTLSCHGSDDLMNAQPPEQMETLLRELTDAGLIVRHAHLT